MLCQHVLSLCYIIIIFHYYDLLWVSEGPSVGTQPKTSEFNNSEIRHIVLFFRFYFYFFNCLFACLFVFAVFCL